MTYKPFTGQGTDFYVASPDAAEMVNIAIALERPILVEGEAGCGKTLLARAISTELGLGVPISISVKSTSRAKDLLYRFDALRRLQHSPVADREKARNIYPYVFLQPFGAAIRGGKPCVVLVDEIDKADIDFPNDLLDVLGEFQFDIEELPEEGVRGVGESQGIRTARRAADRLGSSDRGHHEQSGKAATRTLSAAVPVPSAHLSRKRKRAERDSEEESPAR
jgi:hypothetical protein